MYIPSFKNTLLPKIANHHLTVEDLKYCKELPNHDTGVNWAATVGKRRRKTRSTQALPQTLSWWKLQCPGKANTVWHYVVSTVLGVFPCFYAILATYKREFYKPHFTEEETWLSAGVWTRTAPDTGLDCSPWKHRCGLQSRETHRGTDYQQDREKMCWRQ